MLPTPKIALWFVNDISANVWMILAIEHRGFFTQMRPDLCTPTALLSLPLVWC